MIQIKYTFDGLNGIGYYQKQLNDKTNKKFFELETIKDRLESQLEPDNLVCYIKDRHPFDRWNKRGATSEDFGFINGFDSASFDMKDGSFLRNNITFEKQQNEGPGNNKLILKYKGPKHLLQEDKDYYLGEIYTHNDNFKLTHFHLHFNPVRPKKLKIIKEQTLTGDK
ncbi:hypothetical protein [Maize bushy stunt phytoplasma]|uniref:hypothetical protein n=1 Tax=Maize bushy stunt phytoplasma TaxID=202462 RepID=UPI000AD16FD9|nr:hypothetical protein [Maize bushy stunt phytoplasma]